MNWALVKWRSATQADVPILASLHAEQCARVGKPLDWFDPTKAPALCCIVGELDGKIVGAIGGEMIAELFVIAVDPRFAREALKTIAPALSGHFRLRKIRNVRCFVDRRFSRSIGWLLRKFGFDGPVTEFDHYDLDLVKEERRG